MVLEMKTSSKQVIIRDIIDYLDDNYTDINCRKGLSEKFGINDSYICHLFREFTNVSITEYINTKRIEYVKELLLDSDTRVIDIAFHAGFNNLSYFHRIFKVHTGITPNKYVRRHSNNVQVD